MNDNKDIKCDDRDNNCNSYDKNNNNNRSDNNNNNIWSFYITATTLVRKSIDLFK